MVQKMSKKNVPLPSRPEPPSVEQIVQDIQGAKEDDIVFSVLKEDFTGTGKLSFSFIAHSYETTLHWSTNYY